MSDESHIWEPYDDDYLEEDWAYSKDIKEAKQARQKLRKTIVKKAKIEHQKLYKKNKEIKAGETIECACGCGETFVKRHYQTVFFSNKGKDNCKDRYWNGLKSIR